MSKVIAAIPSSCAVLLTYTANLVTDGTVRFVYQYEDQKTVLHFKVSWVVRRSVCLWYGDSAITHLSLSLSRYISLSPSLSLSPTLSFSNSLSLQFPYFNSLTHTCLLPSPCFTYQRACRVQGLSFLK